MVHLRNLAVIVTALFGLAIIVPVADAGKVIKGSYIITLKPNIKTADVQSHLTWVKDVRKRSLTKRDSSKGIEKVYDSKSGFKGYAGTFDPETIKKIKKNPDVSTGDLKFSISDASNPMARSKSLKKTASGPSNTSGGTPKNILTNEPR